MIQNIQTNSTRSTSIPQHADVVIIGAGHNALVCAIFLARAGLNVVMCEAQSQIGGAVRTEYPFTKAPDLGVSTGAYLLGVMPPELLQKLGLNLVLKRRDPHYFLPTLDHRYLLIGSNATSLKEQFCSFFSIADWNAHCAMNAELAALREDLAPVWLQPPLSLEHTAERYIRKELQEIFMNLVRGSIGEYLDRFDFKSDLIKAMYATTDAFSGLHGGYDTPGTGHNFLVHNMCRLPGTDGTWMIVEGGMGSISQQLAQVATAAGVTILKNAEVAQIDVASGIVQSVTLTNGSAIRSSIVVSGADPFRTRELIRKEHLPQEYTKKLDTLKRHGTTLKVNLAFKKLPTFKCLPNDQGQYGPTIHLLPQSANVIESLRNGYREICQGKLTQDVTIEWYFHTPIDTSLQNKQGHHNGALFVQWVPYELSEGKTWQQEESRYVNYLLSICDQFAPDTSSNVLDAFVLTPPKIEQHFGIRYGHIHHVDNTFAFDQRAPYELPIEGVFACSAGCHPAGSVIGAAGHNAAMIILKKMGRI